MSWLTASEVAGLDLAAEWVILSACNTAAGEGQGTPALSGLAKAFFYAGARSLLVSHWSVYDDASAALTTRTLSLQAQGLSRGEALGKAMADLIEAAASPREAHPAYWGAFALVGELK